MPTDFDNGFLVGLLVGEGSFGGDGRQPQVTLRMHVRHEALFQWIEDVYPGGKLYGPYNHGGRHYYQWMARGAFLKNELLPLLDVSLSPALDGHSYIRYTSMKRRYASRLGLPVDADGSPVPTIPGTDRPDQRLRTAAVSPGSRFDGESGGDTGTAGRGPET